MKNKIILILSILFFAFSDNFALAANINNTNLLKYKNQTLGIEFEYPKRCCCPW